MIRFINTEETRTPEERARDNEEFESVRGIKDGGAEGDPGTHPYGDKR